MKVKSKRAGTGHGTGPIMAKALHDSALLKRRRQLNLGHERQKMAHKPLILAMGQTHVIPSNGRPGERAERGFGTVRKTYTPKVAA